jgi:uncharacterized repeat protein (TIGR04042 family)
MPEVAFQLQWPDGSRLGCVSPSTVIKNHLAPGSHNVAVFLEHARAGFTAASDRVREVYGFPCARAAAQLHIIEAKASAWSDVADAIVTVEFT